MYKHCESVAFYDKRDRFGDLAKMTSLEPVYVRLHQGIQDQKVNSDAGGLLVKPVCFLYSDKIIQSIKTSLIPEES